MWLGGKREAKRALHAGKRRLRRDDGQAMRLVSGSGHLGGGSTDGYRGLGSWRRRVSGGGSLPLTLRESRAREAHACMGATTKEAPAAGAARVETARTPQVERGIRAATEQRTVWPGARSARDQEASRGACSPKQLGCAAESRASKAGPTACPCWTTAAPPRRHGGRRIARDYYKKAGRVVPEVQLTGTLSRGPWGGSVARRPSGGPFTRAARRRRRRKRPAGRAARVPGPAAPAGG
jgi:hypothetical protein